MASIRELCANVPAQIDRMAVQRELLRRKNASFLKRMGALCAEENVFDKCKQTRPMKKWKNGYSREQAGTLGTIVRSVQTSNPYVSVTCKSRNFY